MISIRSINYNIVSAVLVLFLAGSQVSAQGLNPLKAIEGSSELDLSTLKGSWVALHFLSQDKAGMTHQREFVDRATAITVAGVKPVFILSGKIEAPKKWKGQRGVTIFSDAEGSLAKKYNIKKSTTIVVLNSVGKEVFRHQTSKSRLMAKVFSEKVSALQKDKVSKNINTKNRTNGFAIAGYDSVAYFTQKAAVKGKGIISLYKGERYNFSSSKHRKLFNANPESYVPSYGGWCAYAMASGDKVAIDPETFKVTNGKLYLFYNGLFGNTLKKWNNEGEASLAKKANVSWSKIIK